MHVKQAVRLMAELPCNASVGSLKPSDVEWFDPELARRLRVATERIERVLEYCKMRAEKCGDNS